MEEFIIFGTNIQRIEQNDNFFVQLSSDQETGLTLVSPRSVKIGEGLSIGSPLVSIEFVDGNGDFVNHDKLPPDATYFLDVGDSLGNAIRIEMKLSKITLANLSMGESRNVAFSLHFIDKRWYQILGKRRFRGWADTKITEVVTEIAEECGFVDVDISSTKGTIKNIIQPGWSDLTLLQWLKTRASADGEYQSHFEFGVTTNGKFFFKSLGDLITEQRNDIKSGNIPVLYMGGAELESEVRREDTLYNGNIPTFFVSYAGNERYTDGVLNGVGGIESSYYDFDTGKFIRNHFNVKNSEAVQLTDWAGVPVSIGDINLPVHHGRDANGIVIDKNRVSEVMNSLQEFDIAMSSSPFIHIGMIVELVIPVPPNVEFDGVNSIVPFAEMYSGFFFVSAANHNMDMIKGSGSTVVTLSRSGFDGKSLGMFSKTKTGKFK